MDAQFMAAFIHSLKYLQLAVIHASDSHHTPQRTLVQHYESYPQYIASSVDVQSQTTERRLNGLMVVYYMQNKPRKSCQGSFAGRVMRRQGMDGKYSVSICNEAALAMYSGAQNGLGLIEWNPYGTLFHNIQGSKREIGGRAEQPSALVATSTTNQHPQPRAG